MPIPGEQRRSALARQVGSLALSRVRVDNPMADVRAAAWHNAMARLGIYLPLCLVHDVGLLLTHPRGPGGWTLGPHPAAPPRAEANEAGFSTTRVIAGYQELLELLGQSEVAQHAAQFRLRDELVAMLIARTLADAYRSWPYRGKQTTEGDLPLDTMLYAGADVAGHFADFDSGPLYGLLDHLTKQRYQVLTCLELIDLDALRLLGLFGAGVGPGANTGMDAQVSMDLVDLFQALRSPEISDVVNFSMELMPSVLETRRASSSQTFSVDGYASLQRRGNLDSLVLSELAYDEDLFMRKVVDQELFYYGHEKQREEERRLQYVLVDASASMRGERQVFARGLALALCKKLALQGDEVWLRFFDSRLHETVRLARAGSASVPYVLCFRSERGRNYGKVFRQLALELTRLHREARRSIAVHVITHGQCHVPVDLVRELNRLCTLSAVFVLPSGEVTLDYLPLLDRHEIVTHETLASREDRKNRALGIVRATGIGHGV